MLFPGDKSDDLLDILKRECLEDDEEAKCIVRFPGKVPLILATLCSIATVNRVIQKGLVRYVVHLKAETDGLANLLGLFYYSQGWHAPFPYECEAKPLYALKLRDLPEKYHHLFADNRFETIDFSEKSKIQPIELMPCDTWRDDKWWVDTQGNEREGHPDYSSL